MTHLAGVGAAADIIAGDQAPHRGIDAAEARHSCANCGAVLQGAYCHACGQKGHLHTRLWHMAEDFIEGVMHFDGRLWRTLPLLVFRPGRLSRSWIEGKRVRYVAPLHVFLFSIFLFFMTLSLTGGQIYNSLFQDIAKHSDTASTSISGKERTCSDLELDQVTRYVCRAIDHIKKDPKYYSYKAESTTYKAAPLLAPISTLILGLLLLFKRGYSLYDHGVVSLYGLSFLGFFTTAGILLGKVATFDWQPIAIMLLIAHAVIHLRGAYRLSWFGAVARTLLLGLLTSIVFFIFLLGIAALSTAA